MVDIGSNWAGNYSYRAGKVHHPETVEQIQDLVRRTNSKLKVLGSRHSFNDIADSPGELICLDRLHRTLAFDTMRNTVTVDGGARYGQICGQIHREGYALHNMASLPHISVAGACATATHGSGDLNGNLATIVSAIELVMADGSLVKLSRDRHHHEDQQAELFQGVVVALGGLGVITKLTLDLVPAFSMRQSVYERLPLAQLENHLDEITSSADSVSLFTTWQNSWVDQVWLKCRVVESTGSGTGDSEFEPEPDFFGARLATEARHPIPGLSAEACTEQMGVAGPWHERMPHFRMEFTPSSSEELQSEYLLPRRHAVEALHAILRLREYIGPVLQVSEVRTVAADNLWMSPCYGEACVGIHFTWKKDWTGVRPVLQMIEEQLAPFEARPHWGKSFTMPGELVRSLYPRLHDFQQLLRNYDPHSKFRNRFLDTYIFGEDPAPSA
jgi:alditol oxidase